MKKLILIFSLFAINSVLAQNVIFNKVSKTISSTDKFLYKIPANYPDSEYLGEIEIQGYTSKDPEMFGKIYKKAKEIGANAFAYKPFETIDGTSSKFDSSNYRISLYYLPKDKFPQENSLLYIFAPANNPQTISLNGKVIKFKPRTFTKIKMEVGGFYTISTRKLLGSSVKISSTKEDQNAKSFQLSSFGFRSNQSKEGGFNFKTGDIVLLEKSYADFLSIIFQEF